jgi:PilZ domain
MGDAARKFTNRAARYVLNAGDEKLVRVASRDRKKNQIYQMEIIDVSETGMAFIVNWNYLPQIGEILKVEFPVPGEQRKVAWFAKVMRLENENERPPEMRHFSGIKVGVEFIDMPKGHLRTLKAGLSRKTHARLDAQNQVVRQHKQKEWLRIALQVCFLIAAVYGFYLFIKAFTKPDLNYDPKNPVNWGERFFERVIKRPPPPSP